MVVSSSKERAPTLRRALATVGSTVGLTLTFSDIELSERKESEPQSLASAAGGAPADPGMGAYRARLYLVGPDSPGLVHRVALLLASHALNITSMDTRVYAGNEEELVDVAGESGARSPSMRSASDVFDMSAVVASSAVPDVPRIEEAMAALQKELGVSIELEWIVAASDLKNSAAEA
uniref:ACT domain-containing protein n=1 Tax=Octactis speculum TaxID=3111310 RepID=A0A7S2AN57_9STRA